MNNKIQQLFDNPYVALIAMFVIQPILWGVYFYYLTTSALLGWVAGIAILVFVGGSVGLSLLASIIQSASDGEDPVWMYKVIEWALRLSVPVAAVRVVLGTWLGLPMMMPMAGIMLIITGVALIMSGIGFLDRPELRKWLGVIYSPSLIVSGLFVLWMGGLALGLVLGGFGIYMFMKYGPSLRRGEDHGHDYDH